MAKLYTQASAMTLAPYIEIDLMSQFTPRRLLTGSVLKRYLI